MNNKVTALIAVAVVAIIGWLVYSHNSSVVNLVTPADVSESIPAPTTTNEAVAPAPQSTTTGKVDEFVVTGGNFYFAPKTMTVAKGDTVKITFKNSGGMHDFKIDEFSVATPRLNSGQDAVVQFVASKAGTFEYYCSVGTHRQMGMVGTLTFK